MSKTTSSSIPSQKQYEQAELQRAYRNIADVAGAPLSDRKHDTRLVAAAMVFKCLKYANDLDSRQRTESENRALLKLKATALVLTDRCQAKKVRSK